MRRKKGLLFGLFGLTLTTSTAVSASNAQPAPSADAATPVPAAVERSADLIRLWTFVRLFHIDPRAMTPDWERSLEEAGPLTLALSDDAAFERVVANMMARIQPPDSDHLNENPAASPQSPNVPPFRIVAGRLIASCPGIAREMMKGAQIIMAEAELSAIREQGLILDCRGFGPSDDWREGYAFSRWFDSTMPTLIRQPMERGATRVRFHDGYPPDVGGAGDIYSRGIGEVTIPRVEFSSTTKGRARRIVMIADATTPELWVFAGGLRAAGLGGLVAQGTVASPGMQLFSGKHLKTDVMVGGYIGPDGRPGFRPDSCVAATASEAAMEVAVALLAGKDASLCPDQKPTAAPAQAANEAVDADSSAPIPLGQRMVALAKLWGTIEYFFPYHSHTDRPWSETLEEFIPIFAAATTRQAYEEAVQRLAQRTNDSHVSVTGTCRQRLEMNSPPIYIRPLEGRFAVAGFYGATIPELRIGDEIVTVDGQPVAEIVSSLRPYVAVSTPQSFAQRMAVRLTAGPTDSDVRLGIRRGDAAPFEVTVKRSMPNGPSRRPKNENPSYSRIAPDIGYVDLERLTQVEAERAIDDLMDTRAIIFDLRGYPQGTAWTLAPRLALDGREGAIAAQFRRPSYRSASEPRELWTSFLQQIPTGTKPRYKGKIVVLIDDRAVSQSEHTALLFETAAKPVFVGTPTTGANGDVTSVALPGGLSVRFTGHDVRHADGRQLQRVGIQPDILVEPTFEGLRNGRDEVLEAGIKEARTK